MDLKQTTLERLSGKEKLVTIARLWLDHEGITTISTTPAELTASKAAHLWRVRLKVSQTKGGSLAGAETLLARLAAMTPQRKLEQMSFSGNGHSASFLFEKSNGSFVGLVMTDGQS